LRAGSSSSPWPRSAHLGLLARRLELLALAEVGGEGDHLALIFLLEPFQDHRVQAARIGEHDFLDVVAHDAPLCWAPAGRLRRV